MDVALGGQGAPLVPIGDLLLFKSYEYCLNLGGIANISIKEKDSIIAYDICPANMALNSLVKEAGKDFDESGNMARSGKLNLKLLEELNNMNFYKISPPKSLGKEWYDAFFNSILNLHSDSTENKLHTVCDHIAIQISNQIKSKGDMLVQEEVL